MDSGNIAETLGETVQPEEVVVTDSEATEATPQAEATEEVEFYVDAEGDQQQEPNKMDERQTRAAWKEEKRKRKEKAEEVKAEKERADRIEKELQELKSQVYQATRGARPDPYDYDSTDDFYAALEKWQSHGKTEPKPATQAQPQGEQFSMSEDQEFHLHNSEMNLKKSFKDYDDVKSNVESELKRAFNVPNDYPIMDQIASFAHTYDVDPAKVFYVLNEVPDKMNDLVKNAANPAQIGKILRDLESKMKVRDRKPIDSKPEPSIKGGGQIDNVNAKIKSALDKYSETGNIKDFQAYHELIKNKGERK